MTSADRWPTARIAGLCADCAHVRRVESDRGSLFLLCEMSTRDPRFPKYPTLPVRRCVAHEPRSTPPCPPPNPDD